MKKNNLTEGSVLKSLVVLSGPIIIAQLLHTAYQLTDTFWVGRLGANAIAAVSISFPVIFLMIALGGGLTMAGSILVAQYKGKGNQEAINHVAGQTIMTVFFVSLILALVGYLFSPHLLKLMGVEASVFLDAVSYLKISFLGIVFMFLFFVFQALVRGVGDVKTPMYIVLGTVLLNFVLDPLFIFGYRDLSGMGVSGAALATVITQGLSALAGLLFLFYGKRGIYVRLKKLRFDFQLIKKMFFLGLPASIEQSARSLGMIIMTFLVASFGTVAVAAFGIGGRMLSLVIIPSMGFSMATSTLVGQNIGAGKTERAGKITWISALVGFVALTLLGIFFFVFARELASFFIPGEAETIETSVVFIKTISLSFGFIGLFMVISGAFRGAGCTSNSMILSIVSLWVLEFPIAYVLSKHTALAVTGIWIALPVANVISAIIAAIWFLRGSWKTKKITEEIKIAEEVAKEVIIEEGIQ